MPVSTNPSVNGDLGFATIGTTEVYAQPDATGTWAGRPNGLVIPVPTWARFLTLTLCTSGGSGGSGRRGATLTARSGGAGGQAGVITVHKISLRDNAGALIAASGTLTVGASPAGGAAVTTDDTNGNAGLVIAASSFVLAGVTYTSTSGGTAAPGGTTGSVNSGNNTQQIWPVPNAVATNVTASLGLQYPAGAVSPGSPGGSISTADALLTPGQIVVTQAGCNALSNTTAGADGFGQRTGNIQAAVGGIGGAASSIAAAQNGGNGIFGSGGGGGGASLNGFASGAGGRGGAGWAILIWE